MPRKYYSQNGEDCVLWSVFDQYDKGIFLDVGALDGKRFSNTLSFEENGWKGVCIEAHPYYAKLTKKNRPKSQVIHAAVHYEDRKNICFFANKLGSLSTTDGSMENYFKSTYKKAFKGYNKILVPCKTVNTILQECSIPKVDVVSIDVEGTELNVLKGFDLIKYKPRILVIEALDRRREKNVKGWMKNQNYVFARKLGNNLFFCGHNKYVERARKVKLVPYKNLIHTNHPLRGKL